MYGKPETVTDPTTKVTTKTDKRTFTYDPSKDPFKALSGTTAAAPGTPTSFVCYTSSFSVGFQGEIYIAISFLTFERISFLPISRVVFIAPSLRHSF